MLAIPESFLRLLLRRRILLLRSHSLHNHMATATFFLKGKR